MAKAKSGCDLENHGSFRDVTLQCGGIYVIMQMIKCRCVLTHYVCFPVKELWYFKLTFFLILLQSATKCDQQCSRVKYSLKY